MMQSGLRTIGSTTAQSRCDLSEMSLRPSQIELNCSAKLFKLLRSLILDSRSQSPYERLRDIDTSPEFWLALLDSGRSEIREFRNALFGQSGLEPEKLTLANWKNFCAAVQARYATPDDIVPDYRLAQAVGSRRDISLKRVGGNKIISVVNVCPRSIALRLLNLKVYGNIAELRTSPSLRGRKLRKIIITDDLVGPEVAAKHRSAALKGVFPHLDAITKKAVTPLVCESLGLPIKTPLPAVVRAIVAQKICSPRIPHRHVHNSSWLSNYFSVEAVSDFVVFNVGRAARERFFEINQIVRHESLDLCGALNIADSPKLLARELIKFGFFQPWQDPARQVPHGIWHAGTFHPDVVGAEIAKWNLVHYLIARHKSLRFTNFRRAAIMGLNRILKAAGDHEVAHGSSTSDVRAWLNANSEVPKPLWVRPPLRQSILEWRIRSGMRRRVAKPSW